MILRLIFIFFATNFIISAINTLYINSEAFAIIGGLINGFFLGSMYVHTNIKKEEANDKL